MLNCYHCGNDFIDKNTIVFDNKHFCCQGCKIVFDLFTSNDLNNYYNLEKNPGLKPNVIKSKYNYLDNSDIVDKLLLFNEGDISITQLYIPHIHCSSCIWILENLNKLDAGIVHSQVEFSKKL